MLRVAMIFLFDVTLAFVIFTGLIMYAGCISVNSALRQEYGHYPDGVCGRAQS